MGGGGSKQESTSKVVTDLVTTLIQLWAADSSSLPLTITINSYARMNVKTPFGPND